MNTTCKEKVRAKIIIQSDNCKNKDVHGDGDHGHDKKQ